MHFFVCCLKTSMPLLLYRFNGSTFYHQNGKVTGACLFCDNKGRVLDRYVEHFKEKYSSLVDAEFGAVKLGLRHAKRLGY